jgi:glycosyltransferase involved in cell wall biosynthesis
LEISGGEVLYLRNASPGDEMRIGVMLRALDERGGVGVYTRNVTEELLRLDRKNHYVLFYRDCRHLGRYSHYPNVEEVVVPGRLKAFWDQLAIPLACRKHRVDVLFHTKFTVPLLAPCPAVMVVHGADWFIPEHARFYAPLDVAYIRAIMPLYFRRSVSRITTDNFNRILRLPEGKVVTTYLAPGRHFKRITDASELERVRRKYQLPSRFILSLSKLGGGERKNIEGVFEAYRLLHGKVPHQLVIGGTNCVEFRRTYGIPGAGWGADVHFPGWIDQQDMPAVLSLADLYLYPSRLEAFPIPVSEAMACGVPIVTSDVNGLEEIAGDAALRVPPEEPEAIADAGLRILKSREEHARVSAAGLERSKRYSWDKCAQETLAVLERVYGQADFEKSPAPSAAASD